MCPGTKVPRGCVTHFPDVLPGCLAAMSKRQSSLELFGFKVPRLEVQNTSNDTLPDTEVEGPTRRTAAPSHAPLDGLDAVDPPYDLGLIGYTNGRKLSASDRYLGTSIYLLRKCETSQLY